MTTKNNHIENTLWAAADQLWANSSLKPSEYSLPVLGLIFLKDADFKTGLAVSDIAASYSASSRRSTSKSDFQSRIGLFISEKARFSYIKTLPEGSDIGKALNEAMKEIETENEELRGVLPKNYQRIENRTLFELIRILSSIPDTIEGDSFGEIYECGRSKFSLVNLTRNSFSSSVLA